MTTTTFEAGRPTIGSRAIPLPQPSRATLAFAGLLVFIALVYTNPSNLFPQIGDHGYAKMVAGIALAALGGAWLLADRRLVLGGTVGRLFLGFFVIVGASAIWSLWPSLTLTTFTEGVKYFAIFVLVVNVVDSRRRVEGLIHALAWASLAPAIGTITSWMSGEHLVEGDRAAWIGIFANPNDLAYHLAVGGAVAIGARELTQQRWLRVVYLGILGVLATALLLTQSRGGMIAAGTVVALWGIRSLRHKRAALGVLAIVVLVVNFAPENAFRRAGTTLEYGRDASAQGRIDAWRTGVRIVSDLPLSGVGAGAFVLAWSEYAPGDAGPPRTAHNTFIQIASETGVPSMLLFVGSILAALVALEGKARRTPALRVPARTTQIGLVAFLVCSATGGLAFSWPLYLLLGLGAAMPRLTEE